MEAAGQLRTHLINGCEILGRVPIHFMAESPQDGVIHGQRRAHDVDVQDRAEPLSRFL